MNTTPHETPYREIGRGCCGSIWALQDSAWVIKREDCDPHRSVLNDQIMHRCVIAAAANMDELPVQIPASYEIIDANDGWWDTNLALFPGLDACKSYRQERIPAVPLSIRSTLITKYCRESLQTSTKASKKNEDCLIRLYTGKRRVHRRPGFFFNLRNYGLHVDQMEELRLDTDTAESRTPVFKLMGESLVIWMLDYDCVRHMSLDDAGIAQAVHAFWRNDAYFPRPFGYRHTDADYQLWDIIKTRFLERSTMILEKEGVSETEKELPMLWIQSVEAGGARRASIAATNKTENTDR